MALIKHISWIIFCTCLASLLMVTLAQEDDVTTAAGEVDDDVTKPNEVSKKETVGPPKGITEAAPVVVITQKAKTQPPPVAETVANEDVTVAAEPKEVATQAAEVVKVTEMPEEVTAAEMPEIKVTGAEVKVTVAEMPEVKVTEAKVKVTVADVKVTEMPEVKVTEGAETAVPVDEGIVAVTQNVLGDKGNKLFTAGETEPAVVVTEKTEAALIVTEGQGEVTVEKSAATTVQGTVEHSPATTVQTEDLAGGLVEVTESADVATQAPETDQPQTDAAQQTTVVVLETVEPVSETIEPVNVESSPASLTEEATLAGLLVDLKNTTDPVQLVQTTSSLDNPDTTLKPDVQTSSVPDTTLKPDVQTTNGPDTTLKPEAETTSGLQELTTEEKSATTVAVATTQASVDETVLTTVVEGLTTEEKMAAVPTEAVLKSDDPCKNMAILDEDERHFLSQKKDGDSNFCDTLEKKWYGFKYQDQWAEIPSVAIEKGHCSTMVPFRLDLSGGQSLPEFNETVDLQLCTASEIGGELEECMLRKDIQVRGCDGYYIYYLQPLRKTCTGAICTKLPDETVPNHVLANPPAEPEVIPTTEEPLPINSKSVEELTKEEQAGAATATFSYPHNELDRESFLALEKRLREFLAKYLNENPVEEEPTQTQAMTEQVQDVTTAAGQEEKVAVPTADFVADVSDDSQNSVNDQTKQGTESQDLSQTNSGVRRRRRDAAVTEQPQYTADSVTFIGPTPRINEDGKLELALIVKDKDGNVVPAEVLKKALENMENPSDDPAIKQEKVSVGLPVDMVMSPAKQPKKDIWEAHMALWITIIVLLAVCIVTLIVCCVCFRCCDTEDSHPEKSPLQMEEGYKSPSVVIENPLSDEEITRDEAPMLEHENPAFTSNGGGQHLTKDEENGWIVPLEQLTDADKQKSDIENTKL